MLAKSTTLFEIVLPRTCFVSPWTDDSTRNITNGDTEVNRFSGRSVSDPRGKPEVKAFLVVKASLASGANIDSEDVYACTFLMLAASQGDQKTVQVFIFFKLYSDLNPT